jgi:hypothetical protein
LTYYKLFEDLVMRILKISLFFVALLLYSATAFAQCEDCEYFFNSDPSDLQTRGSAQYSNTLLLIIPSDYTVGGEDLETGEDEIGVFIQRGTELILAGAAVYDGSGNMNISVWGEDDTNPANINPGARDGETMLIWVWDKSANDGDGKLARYSRITFGDCSVLNPAIPCKNDDLTFEEGNPLFGVWYPFDGIEALFIPAPPAAIYPEDGQAGVELNPTIEWEVAEDAEFFDFIVATDDAFTEVIGEATETEDYTFDVDLDNFNTDFWWKVRAGNQAGWSDWVTYHARTLLAQGDLTSPTDGTLSLPLDITFEWEAVTGAEQYRIQVADNEIDFSAPLFEADVEGTTHEFEGFDNYQHCYWRVIPLDESDGEYYEGTPSEVWEFQTIVGPPALTTPADEAVAIGLTPTFEWDAATGATYYELEYTTDPLFIDNVVTVNNIAGTTYECPGIDYFTEYFWRVRSHNAIPETSEWADASFTTVVGPASLVAPEDGIGGQELTVTLEWDAPDNGGATMYDLWYSTDPAFAAYTEIAGIEDTEQEIAGLDYYTTYYWMVKAYNADGGTWTDYYYSFRTKVDAPVLSTPANNANDQNAPNLNFEWNDVTGATHYQVQIASNNTFASIVDEAVVNGTSSYMSYDVLFDAEHFWRVRAGDEFGYGDWSAVWSFETEELPVPVLVFPSSNATEVKLNTRFDWEDLLYATYFKLEVSESIGFETLVYQNNTISPAASEFNIPGGYLEPLTEYYWRVAAVYGTQTTPWSASRKFTTQDIPVPLLVAPTNLSDDLPLDITLEWGAVENAQHYNVQISTSSDFQPASIVYDEEGIEDIEIDIPDNTITYMTTYYWRVSLTMDGQTGRWSQAWSFTTQDYPPLDVNLADEISICFGDTDIELGNWIEPEGEEGYYSVTGGSGNYRITWTPNSFMRNYWTANPTLYRTPTYSRYYTIRVYDLVTREIGTDRVYLRVNRGPVLTGIPRAYYIQQGDEVTLADYLQVNGNDPFTYHWEDETGEWTSDEMNPAVSPDETTDYYLTVTDENGCSTEKLVTVVVTDPKQGEYEAFAGVYLHLSPNPTEDIVSIYADFGREVNVEIDVINMMGISVANLNLSQTSYLEESIDMSLLPAGVYMVRFSFDGEILYRKVIKQ